MIRFVHNTDTGQGDDCKTAASTPTGKTRWLRRTARAVGRSVSWVLDRIGFLAG